MNVAFKQKIYAHCLQLLNSKIQELEKILQDLDESAASDTKSSAGDKHETARAMIQIEQETISKQLNEARGQKSLLEKTGTPDNRSHITTGSLIQTNRGYLFLSIAFGKMVIEDKSVMVISPRSPLGIKLMGLRVNDSTSLNGVNYLIECIL